CLLLFLLFCSILAFFIVFFFFFQAEDGIRDRNVTGVQTCALPIYSFTRHEFFWYDYSLCRAKPISYYIFRHLVGICNRSYSRIRSEERRVGKEGRDRWAPEG